MSMRYWHQDETLFVSCYCWHSGVKFSCVHMWKTIYLAREVEFNSLGPGQPSIMSNKKERSPMGWAPLQSPKEHYKREKDSWVLWRPLVCNSQDPRIFLFPTESLQGENIFSSPIDRSHRLCHLVRP